MVLHNKQYIYYMLLYIRYTIIYSINFLNFIFISSFIKKILISRTEIRALKNNYLSFK